MFESREDDFEVHGAVTDADGHEISFAEVTVWQQRIRDRRVLRSGRTDEEGRYRLEFEEPEEGPGRLLIVVEARSERLSAPLESSVLPAQRHLQVDLAAVASDTSEFGMLRHIIVEQLGSLALTNVVEDDEHHDISFLAQETGRGTEEITRLVVAARLEAAFEIQAAVFYAFLRANVPSALPTPLSEATQGFTLIDALVQHVATLIFALTADVQTQTLTDAVARNVIEAEFGPQIPRLVEQLRAGRTTDVLTQPFLVGKASLGQFLDIAGLPAAKHEEFASALTSNRLSMRNFWRTLGQTLPDFTAAEISAVQRTVEIGVFVKNHPPLVQALLQRFTNGSYTTLADLARLPLRIWEELVAQVGPPANIDPAGSSNPAEVYARVVYTRVTHAFPTAALSTRISEANLVPPNEQGPLKRFFANSATLELVKTNLVPYLDQAGDHAFAGIEAADRPAVVTNVKRMQRVLRTSADVDAAQALLGAGIDSATAIATMGRQQFFDKATAEDIGIGKLEANRIFTAAASRYGQLVSTYTRFHRDLIGIWPKAIGKISDLDDPTKQAIARDQSLATLFGSQDYCAVDDCTSVLSPAAYLCDLLLWLRKHPLTGPYPTAKDALFARRPDIGHLLLNCPNTDTPLPYIDLVNELLEDEVSPPGVPVWKQTTLTAAELRAEPEHLNTAAYETLRTASYPHTLPYDRPLDELRTYLGQSGVQLWQLRQALLPAAPSVAARAAVAAERFQIDPHEQDLITIPNDVAASVVWNTAAPGTDLAPVPAFLQAASISYEQLLELLDVAWVRGGGAGLTLSGISDACDLTVESLAPAPLDPAVLDRMHRFLRMWRHGSWQMWELDLLLQAPSVANGTLDAAGLAGLFTFHELQRATGLAADRQLAFFQDMDSGAGHRAPDGSQTPSMYAQLFLTPTVPADPDLAALPAGGAIAHPNLADHLPAIQAALQISAADATALFALTNGLLTIANLSAVYRVITLARSVGASLPDLQRVVPLTAAGTLAAVLASPAATLAFVSQFKALKQSGFTIEALVYVLTTQPAAVGVSDDQITKTVLPAVRAAIQQTHDEVYGSADPPLTILQRELAQLPDFADPAVLATAISIVDDSFAGTLAERNAFIDAKFGVFMDKPTAEADLAPLPAGLTPAQKQADVDQRAQDVLAPLATYLTQTRVIAALAANLQLSNDVTALLTGQLDVPGTTTTLLTVLTDPALIAKPGGTYTPISRANFPDQYVAIDLLDKIGTVVRRLHLVKADLSWLLANPTVYGGLDLAQLPVTAAQPAQPIANLLATSQLVKLDRAFTAAPAGSPVPDLYSLISGILSTTIATDAAAWAALAVITGWRATDIAPLADASGLVFPGDYLKPSSYDKLRTLEAMATATSGSGTQLVSWAVPAPDEAAATSARGALKSAYSDADWLAVAPKMTDPIRDRRSAALQAFLIARRDGTGKLLYGDTNALFEHFLIDVQMSSCEVTTRVIQAYAAVQLFVERCLMGLEEPNVAIDAKDDTWSQWRWMKRYRIWEANREVFLYPENWLIETQRPSRTEIFKKLEQEVHQNENTLDNLETVALNYIDRLDELAHLVVTGTCVDPRNGTIYVVARTTAEPARFYIRSFADRQWTGWEHIPFDIKAHQVVPAVYRGRLCLFWLDVKVSNEPRQTLGAMQQSASAPSQDVAKYVSMAVEFTTLRNGVWGGVQHSRAKLFDMPFPRWGDLPGRPAPSAEDNRSVEALYTIKVLAPLPSPGYGATLFVDIFRSGKLQAHTAFDWQVVDGVDASVAVHLGRAVFDGRFSDLELRQLPVQDGFIDFFNVNIPQVVEPLLTHAQKTYGPDAQSLLPLSEAQADPDLTGEPNLTPQAGSLATTAPNNNATLPLVFTSISSLEQNVGPLLNTATVPFRATGQSSDLAFDPTSYFFYQDTRRCYFVESTRLYQWGSAWLPVPPSNPATAPFQVSYNFHRFYHPYTRLLWHQLAGGGFEAFYDRTLQLAPDTIDKSGADVFSFQSTYQPDSARVSWGEDNEIVDFSRDAAYGVYNWELFLHAPLYVAERLSKNQQFEDAVKWFHFIFDPTRQGPEPIPQRFWIPKPLNSLTTPTILAERINELLTLVNSGDPNAVAEVDRWRRDPFNPFLIADQRPVAYMKHVVMSYLDNLIAWGDNLFGSDSREAINEATLLYVIAAEILGPAPVAVTPPQHADASYDDLEPKLDAFANALVDIENVVPPGGGGPGPGGGMPQPQTFYFKIPPNPKLLGYWSTVADRLFKIRHCQNIAGQTRELPLFDAPIDPGLLVRAQAAGVDLGSVLSDTRAPLPNYRFTALYTQASDFVNAVRAYGSALLTALEKSDAAALSLLQNTAALQLLSDADQMFQWKVDQAQHNLDAANQGLAVLQSTQSFYAGLPHQNEAEGMAVFLNELAFITKHGVPIIKGIAAVAHGLPNASAGAAGVGGSPQANVGEGGSNAGHSSDKGSEVLKEIVEIFTDGAKLAFEQGRQDWRQADNQQKATEAQLKMDQANTQILAAQVALQMAQLDQSNHQEQVDNLQRQIDFLTGKFTNQDLYDWMADALSEVYFQSYRLAYKLCKQVEHCYRYELGVPDSSFIQFGYWDSLKKGLMAGEALNHDLRRMQSSYLDLNSRRFEISRYISLATLDPQAFQTLLQTGACHFDVPESLFDGDYPGHYQRRLVRASVSVVYPNPGRFDNVKGTLTLTSGSIRFSTDLTSGYGRVTPVDPRFDDRSAAVPQKIVLGAAQDDPGLFVTAIGSNITDQRYLPFEGAGAISSWRFEMPSATNEIDLTQVGDVVLHLYYMALDGGDTFKQAIEQYNSDNAPTSGVKVFSVANDFSAPLPTDTAEYPLTPWQAFLSPPPAGADQILALTLSPLKFPTWTRGKTITITGLTAVALAWPQGSTFVLEPQAPLPTADVNLTTVAGTNEPAVASGPVAVAAASLGKWSFKLRTSAAGDFRSLTKNDIGDLLLVVSYQAT